MTERWTYLGPEGTFTEQAARSLAGSSPVELVSATTVPAALDEVRAGVADAACVPLESSVEGSVALTLDELIHGVELMITAEAYIPITFDLLARPGTSLADVRTVGAHPHGHAQVREWLLRRLPGAQPVAASSNGEAAAAVARGELDAAAAAAVAGPRYGLVSLAGDIGSVADAVTRFVLLRTPAAPPSPTGNDRTSVVLEVDDHPGSLLEALTEFASRGINLTRMESRPSRRVLGEYVFPVDADGHISDAAMSDALGALVRRGALLRWLGSYPRAGGINVPAPGFATEAAYRQAAETVSRWEQGERS